MIRRLKIDVPDAWYADDATAVGSLATLLAWWNCHSSTGPNNGYFTNATKMVLIMKPEHLSAYQAFFANAHIQINAHGQQHLGAV